MEHPQSTSVREIPLTQGKVAIVDAADYGILAAHRWYYTHNGYAVRHLPRENGKTGPIISMQAALLQPPPGFEVDHINLNRLDNRRVNLRLATKAQQQQNRWRPSRVTSSLYKGVHWNRTLGYWQVRICHDGKRVTLGYYRDEQDAARAYNDAARQFHGEYARLNPVDD